MQNLRKAQIEAGKIDSRFPDFKKITWNEVYDSEDAILEDLMIVHVPTRAEFTGAVSQLYRGYEYIHSFARTVQSGRSLSEAQMRQAKRLAREIKKAAAVAAYY